MYYNNQGYLYAHKIYTYKELAMEDGELRKRALMACMTYAADNMERVNKVRDMLPDPIDYSYPLFLELITDIFVAGYMAAYNK